MQTVEHCRIQALPEKEDFSVGLRFGDVRPTLVESVHRILGQVHVHRFRPVHVHLIRPAHVYQFRRAYVHQCSRAHGHQLSRARRHPNTKRLNCTKAAGWEKMDQRQLLQQLVDEVYRPVAVGRLRVQHIMIGIWRQPSVAKGELIRIISWGL